MSRWKSLEEIKKEHLRDDYFRARFDAMQPEFLVAREIIAARKASGLSQQGLAEAIGTSQSRISKWEHGEETPRIQALDRIAKATGTKLRVSLERWRATA